MTIEKFLLFWDHHNTSIIEGLIALVVLLSLFLAYRSFFGNKSEGAEGHATAGNQNLDAAQLEKTLQKILENQSLGAKLSANSDDLSVPVEVPEHAPASGDASSAGGGEATAEAAQLRASLSESTKKMEILRTQLAQAQEQLTAAKNEAAAAASAGGAAAAPAAPAAAGMSAEERNEFDNKIKDLEARLAEYEIISEDIADLSKYREENDDLKKQIESLKSGAQAPATAAPEAPTPAAAPPAPEPVSEPVAPKLAAVPDPEPAPEALAELAAQPDSLTPEEASVIDDDLMKEFAAAVEGQQKAALDKAAEKAGDGTAKATSNPDDTDKLMDQFEDFVGNKKS
ncbi:hypothetical protein AZI86_00485 [Bdellovibrio bacteriovorus]|uniref:Uncharacterized protein n=1 Tax=Bdellovibrio bacteriovorus TaxID=959 RepID=A0A150WMF2_BDEBC|nr:hypothetical protein [Bdellovibrio bacteriovorus]KYG65590.1 hypothetical protein AZI86_00485 [Bdellovibrio bacteriovorus]